MRNCRFNSFHLHTQSDIKPSPSCCTLFPSPFVLIRILQLDELNWLVRLTDTWQMVRPNHIQSQACVSMTSTRLAHKTSPRNFGDIPSGVPGYSANSAQELPFISSRVVHPSCDNYEILGRVFFFFLATSWVFEVMFRIAERLLKTPDN